MKTTRTPAASAEYVNDAIRLAIWLAAQPSVCASSVAAMTRHALLAAGERRCGAPDDEVAAVSSGRREHLAAAADVAHRGRAPSAAWSCRRSCG
eukprot:5451725-Prymnesium_polylepis.2